MNRLPETPRFPSLNTFLVVIAVLTPLCILIYSAYLSLFSTTTSSSLTRTMQIAKFIAIGTGFLALSLAIFPPLIIFAINHLAGRNHFNDNTPANSMFAEAYAISENYVLPYAHNLTNKSGERFCELYLSFSYTEILHVHQTLKKRHQLTYRFHTISLPNHLGRRMPLLTRAGAEQILRDMADSANTTGEDIQKQRAVLLYTFWPNCSSHVDLPARQAFISRNVIRDLLSLIDPDQSHAVPNNAEVDVFYDAGCIITLSAGYLNTNYTRIAAEDELVYLPISST